LLVEVQRRCAFAATGMAPHERAPRWFVQRIEPQQLLRARDGLGECALCLESGDELGKDFGRPDLEPLAIGRDPLVVATRQQVAAIKRGGLVEGGTIA